MFQRPANFLKGKREKEPVPLNLYCNVQPPPPAAPVNFTPLHEGTRNQVVEVSQPSAQVYWHEDGDLLLAQGEYELQTQERRSELLSQSAQVKHSGLYSCAAAEDDIDFKVDVAGDIFESLTISIFF